MSERGALEDVDEMSIVERLALVEDEETLNALLSEVGDDLAYDARAWLRPRQLAVLDDGAWLVAYLAGRGTGKNRVGSSWVIDKARVPGTMISLVGRTVADVRDVMVGGESGILALSPPDFRPDYVPSVRKLVWPNGSSALTYSADSPSQLRGVQSHATWCDELAAWRLVPDDSGATSWDHARISTRLGTRPQILVTTTPKRHPVIRWLVDRARADDRAAAARAAGRTARARVGGGPDGDDLGVPGGRVSLHGGSSFENRANLAPEYLQTLRDLYAGTALERQELYGELVLVVDDALWRETDVRELGAWPPVTPDEFAGWPTIDTDDMIRLVGVDPGAMATGDSTGIVVVYGTTDRRLADRRAVVVEDATAERASPERWGAAAVDAARRHSTDRQTAVIVAERNQGGEMVRAVIEAAAAAASLPRPPVVLVHAQQSKRARAEPIVLAYRQDRVRHAPGGGLEDLVDQMLSWEPVARWSPDRMDAMVHAVRALVVDDAAIRSLGALRVEPFADDHAIALPDWRRERGVRDDSYYP